MTAPGRRLERIYTEADLLVAECLREGVWAGLDAPGAGRVRQRHGLRVAARRRRRQPAAAPAAARRALEETVRIWSALEDAEHDHRLDVTPRARRSGWRGRCTGGRRARGWSRCSRTPTSPAGDFVRWCKQVIDLLGQIEQAAGEAEGGAELRRAAQDAIDAVRRGVVAYSSVV